MIHPIDLILHKRDGLELSTAEIDAFVQLVLTEAITPAQLGSFLMAVFQRGLSLRETADLTRAMRLSGEVFDCSSLHGLTPAFTIDKHSTGGVGDKTSLLIAPILAAAGAHPASPDLPAIFVPMVSGRSLGHTGGTLDKLETIPGFSTQLSTPQLMDVLRRTHAVLMGQTPSLVPADRLLYAMRDHTCTVESPFLITASIMSKKLAEDLCGLVLDVKVGSGAFMPTYERSKFLAELMVSTGERSIKKNSSTGTRTIALLTSMDQPLGRFSGNWLEVQECVDILQNRRHPLSSDLIHLSNVLSGYMLYFAGHTPTPEAGAQLSDSLLTSGAAYASWLEIVSAQGGDTSVFTNPSKFHKPIAARTFNATTSGYLSCMDCKQVGWAVQRLGAGRLVPGGPVSAHAGLESHAKLGDAVITGQPLFTLFAEDRTLLDEPFDMLKTTIEIADEPPKLQPLIREVIELSTLSFRI